MYLGKYYAYLHRLYETIIPIHKIYCVGFMTSHLIQSLVDGAKTLLSVFYVSLTVHPGMILVNNQLDAHFFHVCLFLLSTCFGQQCAHHQEDYCIITSGICHSVPVPVAARSKAYV